MSYRILLIALALLILAGGCGSGDSSDGQGQKAAEAFGAASAPLPQGSEPVELDPADFVLHVDNPYWPMEPGSRWVYRENDGNGGEQRVAVAVTNRSRHILGIEATVVHDVVREEGQVVENTYDWYAQDKQGNIWYLGEDTKEYEEGKVVSTEGSWEAGVDGAQAGIIMPADPEVEMAYRQEYYEGGAEDEGEILGLEEQVEVPYGSFDGVLMTKDRNLLDPAALEHKFYAKGVGPVLVVQVSGGKSREELLRFEK